MLRLFGYLLYAMNGGKKKGVFQPAGEQPFFHQLGSPEIAKRAMSLHPLLPQLLWTR